MLKVLHNNPETFESLSIIEELSISHYSLYYRSHLRSNPGKQRTIAKTKLICNSILASLYFLSSYQITSCDCVKHCSVIKFCGALEQNCQFLSLEEPRIVL